MKKALIIDTFSHLHRAYHALPDLRTPDNQPTGAIYGVLKILNHLREHYPTNCGVCVFDSPGKNFRHEMYKEYKANRDSPDEDFIKQIDPLIACIKANGWHCIRIDGIEADDIIGTLAGLFSKNDYQCLISTGDKDLAQLVDEQVTLINTTNGEYIDINIDGVYQKFGVWPYQMVDYLSLIGDTADNIPGVYKVGPKTAQKWISQYGTLENIIAQKDTFKGTTGDNLRAAIDQLKLNKKLITVLRNVDMEFDDKSLAFQQPDVTKLKELYTQLNFSSWLKKLPSPHNPICNVTENIQDDSETFFFLAKINTDSSLDVTCKGPYAEELQKKEPLSITDLTLVLEKQRHIVTHDAKKIFHLIDNDLSTQQVTVDDIALASYVLSSHKQHDLNHISESVGSESSNNINADDISHLWINLHDQLSKNQIQKTLYETVEIPTQKILFAMEKKGVLINTKYLSEQGSDFESRLHDLTESIYLWAGKSFNIQSTTQLQEILFDHLQLPILKKTPKGAPSTDEEVLHQLAEHHEIAKDLLQFRMLSKLKSTYVDGLLSKINKDTGRIHTTYCQTTTLTGRLSSIEPNLQNIPIRTTEGKLIRKAFIATENHVLLSADYSQIELRLLAHLSQDQNLCQAFHEGQDVHTITAAEVLGKNRKNITEEERRWAKTINFGLMYGMSAFSLAKQLGISKPQAQIFIDRYFNRYTEVARFISLVKEFAHKNGYVQTIMGRRIWIPNINTRNMHHKTAAERTATNAPMQGSAADLIKIAMITLYRELHERKLSSAIIMQVHDELILEVPIREQEKVSSLICDIMTSVSTLHVPLEVSVAIGKNWDDAH
ncbi:DNA polymerase I [Candidatus Ichthyocystis hellenicum]|uniref:DNA polymerase I n=1 Tax=Candidatus Ichthyocystis hellenicum TaxID=1561003 RepID=UPI000AFDD96B|nr:DNA polymerase I [Candidatus Ichthyocystis hellenicum]